MVPANDDKTAAQIFSSDAPARNVSGPVTNTPATSHATLSWEYPAEELPKVRFTIWAATDLNAPFLALGTVTNATEFRIPLDASQKFFRVAAEWK